MADTPAVQSSLENEGAHVEAAAETHAGVEHDAVTGIHAEDVHSPERDSVDADLLAGLAIDVVTAEYYEHSSVQGHFEAEFCDLGSRVVGQRDPHGEDVGRCWRCH